MIIMTASELTAHALIEAERLVTRGAYTAPKDTVMLTLRCHANKLPIAIPLAWALFRDMNVEADNSLNSKWVVERLVKNANGAVVDTEIVLNDGV